MKAENGNGTLSVHNPFGISSAVLGRTDETWPDPVVLRLHFKGLGNFEVANGKVKLAASASLREEKPAVRLWKDGSEETPLDAKSPFWMEVRIVDGDGKQAKELPLKDGYFAMLLPKAIFMGNPKSITTTWIDFSTME